MHTTLYFFFLTDTDKMTDSCLSAENVTHSEPGSTILKDKENVNNTEKRKIGIFS